MARLCGVAHVRTADPERLVRDMLTAVVDGPATVVRSRVATLGVAGPEGSVHEELGLAVAVDGSVHNAAELRAELGMSAEASDAALIAQLWRARGAHGALASLNADFGLAVADDHGFWLARDRFGLKPLYYAPSGGTLVFASRPRALFAAGVPDEPDPDYLAVAAAANYRFFDAWTGRSPYRAIHQLPAGHLLAWQGALRDAEAWYQPASDEDADADVDELAADYRDLLQDAVRIRLRGVAQPGFTLSGGLDSSSVLMTAHKLVGSPVQAFSTIYADPTYDERDEIASVLVTGAADWTPVPVENPDLVTLVDAMVRTHDEPVATVTWLTHALLCREAAARGITHLFGGLGGDEQHAGEYDYFFYFFADLLRAGDTGRYEREVQAWADHHDHPVHRKNPDVAKASVAALTDPHVPGRCLPDISLLTRYADTLHEDWQQRLVNAPDYGASTRSYLHSHSLNEICRNTIPCCLRASDRNTTAVGLGDRLPFFDHRLLELALRVPSTEKIRDGITKAFLRRAMRGVLPEETRSRVKKTGWNAPAHVWFGGAAREPFLDLIRSRSFVDRGLYRPDVVERLAHRHFASVEVGLAQDNHMMLLWQVLNVELWLRSLGDS